MDEGIKNTREMEAKYGRKVRSSHRLVIPTTTLLLSNKSTVTYESTVRLSLPVLTPRACFLHEYTEKCSSWLGPELELQPIIREGRQWYSSDYINCSMHSRLRTSRTPCCAGRITGSHQHCDHILSSLSLLRSTLIRFSIGSWSSTPSSTSVPQYLPWMDRWTDGRKPAKQRQGGRQAACTYDRLMLAKVW